MKEKLNIAELLKDCPKGMELDCTMFDNCTFNGIEDVGYINILVKTPSGIIRLTKEGCYIRHDDYAKCVIFPKGKTTWEGFQRPFKDGDILATDLGSVFYLNTRLNTDERYGCYVGTGGDGSFHICIPFAYKECCGSASEEEKQKLFKAIKDNGYNWNAETKTLEKLIEPKFKLGDRIRHKNDKTIINTVGAIYYDSYGLCDNHLLFFKEQDQYELVPNKFDISTLKPFDKVLVRDENLLEDSDITDATWSAALYSHHKFGDVPCPYVTTNGHFAQCVPYKCNEHLLGTTDDCDEYYKTWE